MCILEVRGKLIPMDSTYPEGLLAVPNAEGQSRIIVPPTEVPQQHYGIDFYGLHIGQILGVVDLFTRETILIYLRNRNQDNAAKH
jgi:hypothetical protein